MRKIYNKEDLKNKIYPYLLTVLVLFWTIASVLGIISFVNGQRKEDGIITASAAETPLDVSDESLVNVSGLSFVFNGVLETRPSTLTFYDVNGMVLNSSIGIVRNLDNTGYVNADTIKSISIPSQTGLPGNEYILTFSNTIDTARYNFVNNKWGYYTDGIKFNDVGALIYRRIQFDDNVFMKEEDYNWLEDNTLRNSYSLGYDIGAEDGYAYGYDDGYEAGYVDLLNKLTKLREGMLSFATSAIWSCRDPLYTSDFSPIISFGEFDLGSTYRDTFEDSPDIYIGRTQYITFFFDSADKFTLDLINFSVKYQGASNINGPFPIFNLRVTLDNGYMTNLPFVLSSSSDEVFENQGYFDTSKLALDLNNYIVSLRFDCSIHNSKFQDGADLLNYVIVDNNAIDTFAYELGYETGYLKATDGLQSDLDIAYDKGYSVGKREGYDNGFTVGVSQANEYSFAGLLSAVIDVPVSTFRSLFNFELLGVNLSSFFFTILTILVILAVIKLLL